MRRLICSFTGLTCGRPSVAMKAPSSRSPGRSMPSAKRAAQHRKADAPAAGLEARQEVGLLRLLHAARLLAQPGSADGVGAKPLATLFQVVEAAEERQVVAGLRAGTGPAISRTIGASDASRSAKARGDVADHVHRKLLARSNGDSTSTQAVSAGRPSMSA